MNSLNIFFKNSKAFSQLVGLFFLFLICSLIGGGLQLLIPEADGSDASIRLQIVQQALAQLLTFFLPACLFVLLYQEQPRHYLRLRFGGRYWLLALIAMVIMLLSIPLIDFLTSWNETWNLGALTRHARALSESAKQQVALMLSLATIPDLILQLLVVALVPAVCEEFFFRGCLQQILHRWFGNAHASVLVTALIFSLAHLDLYGFVPRLLMGALLGYLFYCSGSLLVNVGAHFFNNALIVVLYHLYHRGVLNAPPDHLMPLPWTLIVFCAVGALLLFVVYFAKNAEQKPRADRF